MFLYIVFKFVKNGVAIVSGVALRCDGIAYRAALNLIC